MGEKTPAQVLRLPHQITGEQKELMEDCRLDTVNVRRDTLRRVPPFSPVKTELTMWVATSFFEGAPYWGVLRLNQEEKTTSSLPSLGGSLQTRHAMWVLGLGSNSDFNDSNGTPYRCIYIYIPFQGKLS